MCEWVFLESAAIRSANSPVQSHRAGDGHLLVAFNAPLQRRHFFREALIALFEMPDVFGRFGEHGSLVQFVCRCKALKVLGVVVLLGAIWSRHDAQTRDAVS